MSEPVPILGLQDEVEMIRFGNIHECRAVPILGLEDGVEMIRFENIHEFRRRFRFSVQRTER